MGRLQYAVSHNNINENFIPNTNWEAFKKAVKFLNKHGYKSILGRGCCDSCNAYDLSENDKAIYYSVQRNDSWYKDSFRWNRKNYVEKELCSVLWVNWGSTFEDAKFVVEALGEHGFLAVLDKFEHGISVWPSVNSMSKYFIMQFIYALCKSLYSEEKNVQN